jgi:UDP-N-acetyl-D-mannosaminuronic acid dehydrogenase
MDKVKVVTVGLGYIGLPTSALIAQSGIKVHGVDVNQKVVNTINKGKIHIVEPSLDVAVEKAVKNGFLKADVNPVEADTYLIVVPTPFKGDHEPDVSYVKAATRNIIPLLKEDDLYIIESTSPIGTTEKMMNFIYAKRPELKNKLNIAFCPERVLPGQIFQELKDNDRVIGGINQESSIKAKLFYEKFVDGELHLTDCRTAEMCKLVENASRDVQIAFANELSIICNKADINVWNLIDLANKHPRVDILSPGCGVGGHCIAVDPYFIYSQFPLESKIIGQAREINNYKSFWCYEKIQEEINNLKKVKKSKVSVGIFGLTFKPDIDDIRQSPALDIAKKVFNTYGSDILIVEPNLSQIDKFELIDFKHAYNKCDLAVFLVNHSRFKELKIDVNSKKVLDFCGILK